MGAVEQLLQGVRIPKMAKVRQKFAARELKDVAAAIQEELDKGFLKPQATKTVSQQQYSQRPHHEDDLLTDLKKYMKEFEK